MSTYKFELNANVKLVLSAEAGVVVGRATYVDAPDNYFVRYVDGTGCQVERWFSADALEPA